MRPEPTSVLCPACDQPFDTPTPEDAVCPFCAWEFAASDDGSIEDDGGLDRDVGLDLDEDGEPDEGLWPITCPHCSARFAVGEAGVHPCPRCRRTLPIDRDGEVADHVAVRCECGCGRGILATFLGAEEAQCLVCGGETHVLPYGHDYEVAGACPACGSGALDEQYRDAPSLSLAPVGDGLYRCLDCGHTLSLAEWQG